MNKTLATTLAVLGIAITLLGCGNGETTTSHVRGAMSGAESSQQESLGGSSCAQQASWGKCSESWMHPVCSDACGGAANAAPSSEPSTQPSQVWYWIPSSPSASPSPSVDGYSCEQQASWGKCSESWMHPVCSYACGGSASAADYGNQTPPPPAQYPGTLSTLPYPYNNNGVMVPNIGPGLYANNTGLLYPDIGGGYRSFPYSNSTTNGVMGNGEGLVTPNFAGTYTHAPYWNGKTFPYEDRFPQISSGSPMTHIVAP